LDLLGGWAWWAEDCVSEGMFIKWKVVRWIGILVSRPNEASSEASPMLKFVLLVWHSGMARGIFKANESTRTRDSTVSPRVIDYSRKCKCYLTV
jgi:hypothetical protein